MTEIYRRTSCFSCQKGSLVRGEDMHKDWGKLVSYSCDRCGAYKLIYLDNEVMPLQSYHFPDGRVTSYVKRKGL